ncbi:MAG: metallophosphoesterase family protein [Spirochaetota bacterium]
MPVKILVVSDSHGNTTALERIVSLEKPFDYLVHCGDGVADLMHVQLPGNPFVLKVSGNIDRARGMQIEQKLIETIEGFKVYIIHGDTLHVHRGLSGLYDDTVGAGCDVALFGHTHLQYLSEKKPWLFNPGECRGGYYGVISIEEDVNFFHRREKHM